MELKFCWFQRLGSSFYQRQPPDVFYEKSALKSFAIFTGKHLRQSLFSSCNLIKKRDFGTRVFCEFCKVFINTLFYKTWEVIQRLNVSILQQFLALYFAIIYSWQFSISERSLDISSQFLLHKSHAVLCAGNHFIGSETPNHNTFDQFWKIKFHFEHFPRNTKFLSFDGPTNYLYLFKSHRYTFSCSGERLSSNLKVSKMWFGPSIKCSFEPFFADFLCREGITCFK